jgi:hypothetical protein
VADPTPPAVPFDQAAHAFRDAMLPRADGHLAGVYPFWHGWALVEAFEAGRASVRTCSRCDRMIPAHAPDGAWCLTCEAERVGLPAGRPGDAT